MQNVDEFLLAIAAALSYSILYIYIHIIFYFLILKKINGYTDR